MIPNGPPPIPIPIPGASKCLLPQGKQIVKNTCLMIHYNFYENKNQESTLPGGFKRGPHENYSRRFPEGVQKEEIQQWRQSRLRSGEKETLNIMLGEWNINSAIGIHINIDVY